MVVRRRRVVGEAREVIPVEGYRTPLWHGARRQGVSASEVAVIVGLSPYDSAFNLWWHKKLDEGGRPDTGDTRRGRRLEPLVLEDFADDHPEFHLTPVGLLQNRDRPWQFATPDSVATEGPPRGTWTIRPVASVEAKTDRNYGGWGEPGTDQVPLHYRAQAMWQMDVLGVEVCYVPVWLGLDYREYQVTYDPIDVRWLREQAQAFLASLDDNRQPPLDSHARTTERLKVLHPTVTDADVEVDQAVVAQYLAAQRLRDAAADRLTLAENRLRHQLGDAARGVVVDDAAKTGLRKVVSRSVYDVTGGTYTRQPYTVNRLNVTKQRKART